MLKMMHCTGEQLDMERELIGDAAEYAGSGIPVIA